MYDKNCVVHFFGTPSLCQIASSLYVDAKCHQYRTIANAVWVLIPALNAQADQAKARPPAQLLPRYLGMDAPPGHCHYS